MKKNQKSLSILRDMLSVGFKPEPEHHVCYAIEACIRSTQDRTEDEIIKVIYAGEKIPPTVYKSLIKIKLKHS